MRISYAGFHRDLSVLTHSFPTRSASDFVTRIELLLGIAVVSVLLATGVRMFGAWIQNTQIRIAAESIQNGVQLARNEAVKRNANVRFELTSATGVPVWRVCVMDG